MIPRLLRRLQQGRYLLAIDNLETVLTTAGEWQSGYDLFFDGFQELGSESVLLLGSREYPPRYFGWKQSRWPPVVDGLEPTEGAALLVALEVEDTAENRATLSTQVQGNPLALALMAGWLRETYRPRERLVEHLQQQTDLFQVAGKHRGEAQVSVDRVLQWSLDRLTLAQQHLLTQVSVLRGAFNNNVATALVSERSVGDADLEDLERRSLVQRLPDRDKEGLQHFRLQPRIREYVQRHTPDLTTAHERAIGYFWSQRQTEFAPDDILDVVSHYEETFYHQCQLGHYPDAAATVFACDKFLQRRGYYQTLVALYHPLCTYWKPTLEQRQTFVTVSNNLGNTYRSLGQFHQSIKFYQQSLSIIQGLGEASGSGIMLGNSAATLLSNSLIGLGNAHCSLRQSHQAIQFYQQSLEISREIGYRNGEAISLGNLGNAYDFLGQPHQAIEFYQQALEITRKSCDRGDEVLWLGNLGNAYKSLGQYQQAIWLYQQSLVIHREIGSLDGEAFALANLGNVHQSLGHHREAIEFCQQSLAILRKIGVHYGEAGNLNNLGNAYWSLGQYHQAIEFHQQALAIRREIGDRHDEANSLNNLAMVYQSLGQFCQAIEFYQQALSIRREISDRNGEAGSLSNLGNAYQSLGQSGQAIEFYQQSLEIQRKIYEAFGTSIVLRDSEARSLVGLGIAHTSLGQSLQAIKFYQQSLEIHREIGDRSGEAGSLSGLGDAHRSLGQYSQAIDFYQQSLAITREIGNRSGEAGPLVGLGSAYRSSGQCPKAIDFYQQSLAITRETGDRSGEATSLNNLGNVYSFLEQYSQAIDFYQQSLAIQREIGDRNGEALSLWNLNSAYQQQGKISKSREYRLAALRIWQALELPIDAVPLPEISKRMFKAFQQPDRGWAESMIQSLEQLGWLMDIFAGVGFLVSLPIRLLQRFKKFWLFWFLVGLAIVLIVWWLR